VTTRSPRRRPPTEVTELWAAGRLGKRAGGPPEIIFGQVREDAAVEVAAFALREPPEAAFCIGSGGCTAFSLLIGAPETLHVVDINPAQVHLLELKKAAFERLPYPDMLRCMTADARPAFPALRPFLTPEAGAFWDQRGALLALGLNQCGIVDRKLRQALRLFLPLLLGRRRIEAVFASSDLSTQRRLYQAYWDNWRWRAIFRWALSRPVLRLVYGQKLVERVPAGFPRLMKQRIDAAFLDSPLRENGYLWQTFLERYPPCEAGLPLYLQKEHHSLVSTGMTRVTLAHGDAAAWLAQQPPASIGFFALSNILEVTTPEYTAGLVQAILKAAKPEAVVCTRSIFPPRADDLCRYQGRLTRDDELSEKLMQLDRSLFCRFIQVFRVNR
jgi:S-adenosylmethionine-diacylglycerol 3-amino-3-carboxypropyl transferase